jgi:hypothetical protein
MSRALLCAIAMGTLVVPSSGWAGECDTPSSDWLFCEDFEKGAQGWANWFPQSPFVECLGCASGNQENPARIMLSNAADHAFEGSWGLYMPAEGSAGYRGAALTYRSCAGNKQPGCTLTNYDELYYRAYVRLAPDHRYVHHFMSLGGTRPNAYWEGDGNAGCRPNGYRAAGTTVDFKWSQARSAHELFFYTYTPDMRCDSGGYCSGSYAQSICDGCAAKGMPCTNGLECCWGNHYSPTPKPLLEVGRWVCLEMQLKLNTPGAADGEMAFWVDGQLGHRQQGMYWRDVPELGLNKVWVQHYIDGNDASAPNRIAWDNLIASRSRIGCLQSVPPEPDGGTPPAADGGSAGSDAGTQSPGADGGASGSPDAGSGAPLGPNEGAGLGAAEGCTGCGASGGGLVLGSLWAWALGLSLRRGRAPPK